MADTTWINQLHDAKACKLAGVVLHFNTSDRVYTGEEGDTPLSLKFYLAKVYHQAGYHVGRYSLSGGFTVMVPPWGGQDRSSSLERLVGTKDTQEFMSGLGAVLRDPNSKCVIIMEYASHIAPSLGQGTPAGLDNALLIQLETLHAWSLDDDIKNSGNFLILINHINALNTLIEHEGGFRPIQVSLPDLNARQCFTRFMLEVERESRGGSVKLESGFSLEEFARLSNGLRLIDIEELFNQAAAHDNEITRDQLKQRKRQTINQLCGGLLEVAETNEGFEAVAGCHHAKSYFKAIRPLWGSGHASLPQAILLAGVPGSGKSFLIKSIAKEFNCPCLIMRGVREMWVGQSERNLDRILQVVDSLAPCILWTDEVDQTLGGQRSSGPSSDSGTNERLLGRLLEFFGDSRIRGRVLWIATTNRPDLLDVAIKDRFSVKIPFLHPNHIEREELIPVLARQVGRDLADESQCIQLAYRSEFDGLTIRSLQEVIVWAGTLADMEAKAPGTEIRSQHLDHAISDYKPTFDPLEHEMIALISLQMTSFNSLLPWRALNEEFRPSQIMWPHYLERMIDPESGRLDHARLEARIRELQQTLISKRT